MNKSKMFLATAILTLSIFSLLITTASATPLDSNQKINGVKRFFIPPPREIWILPSTANFHLTANGWASTLPPDTRQKATLEACGIIYLHYPPVRPLNTKEAFYIIDPENKHMLSTRLLNIEKLESGHIKLKRLTVSVGDTKVVFQNGGGRLSEKHIFIHASTKTVFSAQTETATKPIYAYIWLYGQRNGEEVQLKGLLLIHSARTLTLWRLTLAGELEVIYPEPRPLSPAR